MNLRDFCDFRDRVPVGKTTGVSLKVEYLFVYLGETSLHVVALGTQGTPNPNPSTFDTVFKNQFQVVRGGLNFHF